MLTAQYGEQAAEHAVRSAQGALLPTVSVSARSSRSADWVQLGLPTYSNSIGVSVTVPLYQSGAEYSSIRGAKESNVQSQLALDDDGISQVSRRDHERCGMPRERIARGQSRVVGALPIA